MSEDGQVKENDLCQQFTDQKILCVRETATRRHDIIRVDRGRQRLKEKDTGEHKEIIIIRVKDKIMKDRQRGRHRDSNEDQQS